MPFKLTVVSGVLIVVAAISILVFQNCAKAKFNDPDTRYSMMSMGLCQECGNASGRGLSCRSSKEDPFPACVIESCNPGYKFEDFSCVPVVCTPNSVANCTVPHGEGRMTCNSNGRGYGACMAMDCETGYTLASGACVAVAEPENPTPTPSPTLSPTPSLTPSPAPEESPTPTTPTPSVTPSPAPVCVPETHRDCSTDSTYGTQTCNSEGSGYGACVLGECKAGYNNQDGGDCVANLCEPGSVTPCTLGAGTGFKTCNSQGAGWGTCAINGCQQGYILQNGVCTVQVCTPGQQTVCEFANGSGVKTCNQEGSDYGSCTLLGCQKGYFLVGNQCLDQKCVPSSQDTCVGESGTGVMYCYENGQGHGPCQLTSCDPGFKLKGGQCVSAESCDAGETEACTQQFGTGIRTCNTNSHKLGPCELTACNPGYQLVNQNGNACKKIN